MTRKVLQCPEHLVAGLLERTLTETAELAGVSRNTVVRWRREHHPNTPVRQGKTAKALVRSSAWSKADMAEMRRLHGEGVSPEDLAERFSISADLLAVVLGGAG